MTDNQSTPQKIDYLWYFYPVLLLALGYINRTMTLGELRVSFIDKLYSSMGSAIIFLIVPLIVLGVRKIFTKKKLSAKHTLILFYGLSILIFIISTIGLIWQSNR